MDKISNSVTDWTYGKKEPYPPKFNDLGFSWTGSWFLLSTLSLWFEHVVSARSSSPESWCLDSCTRQILGRSNTWVWSISKYWLHMQLATHHFFIPWAQDPFSSFKRFARGLCLTKVGLKLLDNARSCGRTAWSWMTLLDAWANGHGALFSPPERRCTGGSAIGQGSLWMSVKITGELWLLERRQSDSRTSLNTLTHGIIYLILESCGVAQEPLCCLLNGKPMLGVGGWVREDLRPETKWNDCLVPFWASLRQEKRTGRPLPMARVLGLHTGTLVLVAQSSIP